MNKEQEEREVPAVAGQTGLSRGFVVGLLALGVLLGFSIGLLVAGSGFTGSTGPSALFDEDLVTELFDRASPAVVELDVASRSSTGSGSGSGFFVDRDGHIVTNNHVIENARSIRVRLHDGRTLEATKLGNSPADDLALLQVDPAEVSGIDPLPLADSVEVVPGQLAIAIGSPFRNFNSVTVGVVSGRGRAPVSALLRPMPDMIQTDAPLNAGNSGGPLLNSSGEVIGVNSSIRTSPFQGLNDEFRIGFAVPSNTLENLLPQLVVAEQVRRPWLGISSRSISANLMEDLDIPAGIPIASVYDNSPAQSIGLEPFRTVLGAVRGDVITAVDGRPVSSVDEMVSYFNTLLPGHTITLTVYRDMDTIELDATLAPWPDT